VTRRRDGGTSRDGAPAAGPSSVPEVGRLLRRARTRQGLRLEDASARTGVPLDQLEALEAGTVDRIPDRVWILGSLRRYADFLGLPGDRFVLAVVDHWPSPAATPAVVPVPPRHPVARTPVAAVAAGSLAVQVPPVAVAPTAGAGVGAVTRLDVGVEETPLPTGVQPSTAQVPIVPNTGVIPAVRPAARPPRPGTRPLGPTVLGVAVVALAVAVVAGVGLLVVNHYEPRWLRDIGLTHAPGGSAGPAAGGTTTTTFSDHLVVTKTSPNAVTFSVATSSYQVAVVADGGPSWVQATVSGQPAPVYSGVLAPGQTQHFSVTGTVQIEMGSVAAHVTVTTGLHLLGTFVPTAAPFTMTVSPQG
jgi:hypothetical protein